MCVYIYILGGGAVLGLCCGQASLVVVHGLSCPVACRIFVPPTPQGGQNHPSRRSPALEGGFLTAGPYKEIPGLHI